MDNDLIYLRGQRNKKTNIRDIKAVNKDLYERKYKNNPDYSLISKEAYDNYFSYNVERNLENRERKEIEEKTTEIKIKLGVAQDTPMMTPIEYNKFKKYQEEKTKQYYQEKEYQFQKEKALTEAKKQSYQASKLGVSVVLSQEPNIRQQQIEGVKQAVGENLTTNWKQKHGIAPYKKLPQEKFTPSIFFPIFTDYSGKPVKNMTQSNFRLNFIPVTFKKKETFKQKEIKPSLKKDKIPETEFEKDVRQQEERDKLSYIRQQRIDNLASYMTFGKGKPIEQRSFFGQASQHITTALLSPVAFGANLASASNKAYIIGKNYKEIKFEALNTELKRTYKDTDWKGLYDPSTPSGFSNYILSGVSSYSIATRKIAQRAKPPELPKDLIGTKSQSFFTKNIDHTSYSPATSSSGGVFHSSDILLRDTHTFREINQRVGNSPIVDVFRYKKNKTSLTRVNINDVSYSNIIQKGLFIDKVSIVKQKQTSQNIKGNFKTTTFFSKSGNIKSSYKPIDYKTQTPQIIKQETSIDKVQSNYNYLRFNNKMIETRSDIYAIKTLTEAKLSKNKKVIIEDRNILTHKQKAESKATQVFKSEGLKIKLTKEGKSKDYSYSIASKGQYPELKFGKLKDPKDLVDVNVFLIEGGGKSAEIIHYKKLKGSRLIRNTENIYKSENQYRRITFKSTLDETFKQKTENVFNAGKSLIRSKKANLITRQKYKLNIGESLKPSFEFKTRNKFNFNNNIILKNKPKIIPFMKNNIQNDREQKQKNLLKQQQINILEEKTQFKYNNIFKINSEVKNNIMEEQALLRIPRTQQKNLFEKQTINFNPVIPQNYNYSFVDFSSYNNSFKPIHLFNFKGEKLTNTKDILKNFKQPKAYTPSLYGAVFKIKGETSNFGVMSGLGIRSIR